VLTTVAGNGTSTNVRSGVSVKNAPLGGTVNDIALLGNGTLIYSSTSGAIRNLQADGTQVIIAGVQDTTVAAPGNDVVLQSALYPDDGTLDALQLVTATVPVNNLGGMNPGALSVDGATIFFFDLSENRIRSFTVGGKIKTVFGEVGEGGQSSALGFRGNGTPAAPNTPRTGVVVSGGPNSFLATAAAGDDSVDNSSRPRRIFAGAGGISDSTATGDDVQVVAVGSPATDDQTPRNDDPRNRIGVSGRLIGVGGVVTFVDVGNGVVRQFTVGGNVTTIAGSTDPNRANNLATGVVNSPKNSTNNPIPALGAPITSPGQIASDSTGNLYFDAFDIVNNHNIWKFDAAASTISVVAGRTIVNGYNTALGEGGSATSAPLTGLGLQTSVLADGTIIFAETNRSSGASNNIIRAVSPTGVITTLAGRPGISVTTVNGAPDVDYSTVKADGSPVNSGRVGQNLSDVMLSLPYGMKVYGRKE